MLFLLTRLRCSFKRGAGDWRAETGCTSTTVMMGVIRKVQEAFGLGDNGEKGSRGGKIEAALDWNDRG